MQLPNCINPKPLTFVTSKGSPAIAWDFVVNPAAVEQAVAHAGVMQLLIHVVRAPRGTPAPYSWAWQA